MSIYKFFTVMFRVLFKTSLTDREREGGMENDLRADICSPGLSSGHAKWWADVWSLSDLSCCWDTHMLV